MHYQRTVTTKTTVLTLLVNSTGRTNHWQAFEIPSIHGGVDVNVKNKYLSYMGKLVPNSENEITVLHREISATLGSEITVIQRQVDDKGKKIKLIFMTCCYMLVERNNNDTRRSRCQSGT